jgi:hypothetical protein
VKLILVEDFWIAQGCLRQPEQSFPFFGFWDSTGFENHLMIGQPEMVGDLLCLLGVAVAVCASVDDRESVEGVAVGGGESGD